MKGTYADLPSDIQQLVDFGIFSLEEALQKVEVRTTKVTKEDFDKAKANAIKTYEEENGEGEWDNANQYEREDYVWAEYEKVKESKKMTQMRDAQGRFVSTKKTDNEIMNEQLEKLNSNKKEINTMRTNNKENRMAALQNAGLNVNNFFDVNMKLPMGAMIQVTFPNGEVQTVGGLVNGDTVLNPVTGEFVGKVGTYEGIPVYADPIANQIMQSGYVKNTKLFRRFVAAHTFKLLGKVTVEQRWNRNVVYRSDWDKNFNKDYGYGYQFSMTLEELRVLSILEKEDAEAFAERSRFFTQDVVVALCKQYMRQLKKFVKKSRDERKRTCQGKEYVKLAKYGNVFITDLQRRVYQPMEFIISVIEGCDNYSELYGCFSDFCKKLNKLPYETPKAPEFKTAYRANGAFYTMKNLIMYHNVNLEGCDTSIRSMQVLNGLLNVYKGEYWRFHELLKKTVYDNHFDLAESIDKQNN